MTVKAANGTDGPISTVGSGKLKVWSWRHNGAPRNKDARRDLVRAAALIVAEIERLDRKAPSE
jgi:hypothetical protein